MTALGPYVPFEHWPAAARNAIADAYTAKAAAATERIGRRALAARCSCAHPGEAAADGRCARCWGWPF